METPSLLIMAAGAGRRYGALKQLAPIGPRGETLLEYSAYDALRAGFSRVILVVRPEDEAAFRERLDGTMGRQASVVYVHQRLDDLPDGLSLPAGRTRPWGTGQAVLAAEREIEGPFAVANADDYYGADVFPALRRFLRGAARGGSLALAVVGYEVSRTLTDAGPVSRAVCRLDPAGGLRDILEITGVERRSGRILGTDGSGAQIELLDDELVSMNLWGSTEELFPELRAQFRSFLEPTGHDSDGEFMLPEVVRALLRAGRAEVRVLGGAGEWCGLTFREDRQRVSELIRGFVERGRYPEELWA